MACTFEQVGKETRIEIPPRTTLRELGSTFIVVFVGWCLTWLFVCSIQTWQGLETDPFLASLIGLLSCLPLFIVLWLAEAPAKGVVYFLRDMLIVVVGCVILAIVYCAISQSPWANTTVLWTPTVILMGAMGGVMSLATSGYREEIRISNSTIEVARSWLQLRFETYRFERKYSDVDLELQSPLSFKGPPVPQLQSVLLFDATRRIQLGLMQSEEDLRRIHAILQPLDVINSDDGIWEFSDLHLRRVSKSELAHA